MALADILQKTASFTLFTVSVYLTGDLIYRIQTRKKQRLIELAEPEEKTGYLFFYIHILPYFAMENTGPLPACLEVFFEMANYCGETLFCTLRIISWENSNSVKNKSKLRKIWFETGISFCFVAWLYYKQKLEIVKSVDWITRGQLIMKVI